MSQHAHASNSEDEPAHFIAALTQLTRSLTGEKSGRIPIFDGQRVAGEPLKAAFIEYNEGSANMYHLVVESGSILKVETTGSHCSACDDNEAFTPPRGMPAETAQAKRAKARCPHAEVANNLPLETQCDCGSWEYEQRGPVAERVTPTPHCVECGE